MLTKTLLGQVDIGDTQFSCRKVVLDNGEVEVNFEINEHGGKHGNVTNVTLDVTELAALERMLEKVLWTVL